LHNYKIISNSYSSNTLNQSSAAKGFGKLFKKKRSKSMDKKESISSIFYHGASTEISQNKSGIHDNNTSTKITAVSEKYVLPPLNYQHQQRPQPRLQTAAVPIINVSMGDKPVILSNNHVYKPQYHHYQVGAQPSLALNTNDNIRDSKKPCSNSINSTSTRKSTGSGSIYSTFGSESIYGENESSDYVNTTAATSLFDIHDEKQPQINEKLQDESIDLASIVANNVQTRNPARRVTNSISDEEEDEDDDEDDDDDDDDDDEQDDIADIQTDVFVDATGVSQEDMERERIEARLSKRLSGGHFGSAGGLMISIMAAEKQQRRTSRPPPEDVVQSMMNWKRQSGHGMAKFVSLDHQHEMEQQLNELQSNKVPVVPEKDLPVLPPPLRPLPPNPEILLSPSEDPTNEAPAVIDQDASIATDDPKECASRLWHEDESFVQRERIAEWLGQRYLTYTGETFQEGLLNCMYL
jgi:hypothetical protein